MLSEGETWKYNLFRVLSRGKTHDLLGVLSRIEVASCLECFFEAKVANYFNASQRDVHRIMSQAGEGAFDHKSFRIPRVNRKSFPKCGAPIVVLCTLFFTIWMTFLLLAISYLLTPNVTGGNQNVAIQKAGGLLGLLAAFLAWYAALAGLADNSNSFFTIFVWHFPWSEKGLAAKQKTVEADV